MDDHAGRRRLVLVVGAGRSGTSLTAGLLNQLGYHVPQPEVMANFTNPRGFGEPRWVVDFHADLMQQRSIGLFDARPAAWTAAREAAERPEAKERLLAWLAQELTGEHRIVVKDPRTVWFLPLWRECADALGVDLHYVTTLRHPTEVLRSIRTTAGNRQTEATRACWWISTMLNAGLSTRGARHAYLLYEDLLTDWRTQLERVERVAALPLLTGADEATLAAVGEFVDPSLRRSASGWADVDVPPAVQELADEVWDQLTRLSQSGEDAGTDGSPRLDELLERYNRFYSDAEAIADSSVTYALKTRPPAVALSPEPLIRRVARRLPSRLRRRLRHIRRAVARRRGTAAAGHR